MGEVWKAYDRVADRTVAIKFLKPTLNPDPLIDRFVVEARAVASLNHPNVVALYDLSDDPKQPYMVLEYVSGQSLDARLKDKRTFTAVDAARIGEDMARGVHAANAVGVIHRDLKPSNVMLADDGTVKVLDFGLAKRMEADDGLTPTDQKVGGTPGYMAPEQLDAEVKVDPRIDVWGVGATLYALLTGRSPFPTGSANIAKVVTDELEPPRQRVPTMPKALDAVVTKCLAKNPTERYESVEQLAIDLGRWRRGEPTRARPLTKLQAFRYHLRRTPRSTRWLFVVFCICSLIVIAIVVWPEKTQNDAIRDRLKAGVPATIIGEVYNPNHKYQSHLENPSIGPSPLGDGATSISAWKSALVELCDDPGIDRYRISLEMRYLGGRDDINIDGDVGFYFNHFQGTCGDGTPFHAAYGVVFRDKQNNNKDHASVYLKRIVWLQQSDGRKRNNSTLHEFPFKPSGFVRTKWRPIEIEVCPDRLAILWKGEDDIMAHLIKWNSSDIKTQQISMSKHISQVCPGGSRSVLAWLPRSGFGICVDSTNVAVKNVVISSINY